MKFHIIIMYLDLDCHLLDNAFNQVDEVETYFDFVNRFPKAMRIGRIIGVTETEKTKNHPWILKNQVKIVK